MYRRKVYLYKVAAYSWCHEGLGVPLSRSGGLTCTPLISPAGPYLIVSLSPETSRAVPISVSFIPLFFFFLSLYSVFCARVTATNAPRRKKRIHTVRLPTHFFLLPLSDVAWRVAIASFLFPKKYLISAPRYSWIVNALCSSLFISLF